MRLMTVRGIHKSYRQGGLLRNRTIRALDGVDLDIEAGRCLAVVGPSGSGKSTLGRIVLGLERPDAGEVLYRGERLADLRGDKRLRARRNLQVVFQNSHGAVNPRFTAGMAVAEPLRNFDGLRGKALERRIASLLETVGLAASDMNKLPHQFSGGELQRVCLARALASNPEMIVLDEAVSSLDMLHQSLILDLILDLKRRTGTAFLFISHDLRGVCRVADSLAVIDGGRVASFHTDMDAWNGAGGDSEALRELARAVLPAEPVAG